MLGNSLFIVINLIIFLLSVILVRMFCSYANKKGLLAIPNARSSHEDIIPLGGGIIFILFWCIELLFAFFCNWFTVKELLIFLPGTLMVSVVGYWDDYKDLTAKKRLITQVVASILCVAMVGEVSSLHLFGLSATYLGSSGIVLTILGLVWSTNLYNFMDGLDGVAAVEALFVFGVGGLLFWDANATKMALLVWSLVPIIAGFLVWNWPKARVFMGDVGSYCLGFLVALFSLIGDLWYNIPVAFWFILYGVFWFDATITVIRRFCRLENLAVAHREHACQRLQRIGLSHVQVLSGVIVINIILSSMVLLVLFVQRNWLKWGLLITVIILAVVYLIIEKLKPMERVKS